MWMTLSLMVGFGVVKWEGTNKGKERDSEAKRNIVNQ